MKLNRQQRRAILSKRVNAPYKIVSKSKMRSIDKFESSKMAEAFWSLKIEEFKKKYA